MNAPASTPTTASVVADVQVVDGYELVIGLECHAELHTATKIFCGCPNNFGDEPNTNVCPVCLGLPGSLPVLNRTVVELAIRLGSALHCTVQSSIFHRKNYFYPDMPKDYQVSQYDIPIDLGGYLDLPSGSRVGITRAHLEEDTGKSSHQGGDGRLHGSSGSLVDYNRAGVPLLEIVSEPEVRSADQAREYLTELRSILEATGVSDAKMEEGSLRCDANVSVRKPGAPYGTRCEIKNLNSIRSLGRAIEAEARRQVDLIESGGTIRQETRHFDERSGQTHTLRVKENSDDYRYFPEPDLVPVVPDDAWLARVRAELPMLPAERRARLAGALSVPATDETVGVLVERGRDELFFATVDAGGAADRVAVHLQHNLPPDGSDPIRPAALAAVTKMEAAGALTATQAKVVLADLVAAGGDGDPAAIAATKGFEAMSSGDLGSVVDAAIAAQPEAWAKYLAGDPKVIGAFVGSVMKATKGKADGKAVTALLEARRADGA
jgi:aspartyl-tRNA(Asn)/glutamyl-tRNA(Gln) amidotransferase subunit B